MKFIDNKTIKLEKELNDLDLFVIKFIRIIEKYIDYVIISGYVSILLGRSRATEDVDLFIKNIGKQKFEQLYEDLKKNGFWCLNAESVNEIYSYLTDNLAIRFAEKGEVIPNFEVKIAKDNLSLAEFSDFISKLGSIPSSSAAVIFPNLETSIIH